MMMSSLSRRSSATIALATLKVRLVASERSPIAASSSSACGLVDLGGFLPSSQLLQSISVRVQRRSVESNCNRRFRYDLLDQLLPRILFREQSSPQHADHRDQCSESRGIYFRWEVFHCASSTCRAWRSARFWPERRSMANQEPETGERGQQKSRFWGSYRA